ncbi:Eukaryotic translation initiation factor 1 [Sciurus carolinensis]|uniref:Eukaryotic translation initiation factor 1 n=1 Tax=Sciurus carolinensis TaxID=30640 RepID=A0AA41SUW4_SCICA|nr:Eukaryotic translation initiation factor 1 [Sciurus carolinensis]
MEDSQRKGLPPPVAAPFSLWWTMVDNDPFADASKGDDLLPAGTEDYIHIRIQQRNGRKTLTTVQGIADDYDKKKLVKAFKKKFACNGTVIEHPEYGEVIQLQGDQRKNICQFLVEVSSGMSCFHLCLFLRRYQILPSLFGFYSRHRKG